MNPCGNIFIFSFRPFLSHRPLILVVVLNGQLLLSDHTDFRIFDHLLFQVMGCQFSVFGFILEILVCNGVTDCLLKLLFLHFV